MSDDEKLSRPSFEPMTAGVSFGSDEFAFTADADDWLEVDAIDFETIIMDKETNESRRSSPTELVSIERRRCLAKQARFGAAGSGRYSPHRQGQIPHDGGQTSDCQRRLEHRRNRRSDGAAGARRRSGKPTIYSEAAQALSKLKQHDPAKAAG